MERLRLRLRGQRLEAKAEEEMQFIGRGVSWWRG